MLDYSSSVCGLLLVLVCVSLWLFHVKGHVRLALIIINHIYWEAFSENVYLNTNIFLLK